MSIFKVILGGDNMNTTEDTDVEYIEKEYKTDISSNVLRLQSITAEESYKQIQKRNTYLGKEIQRIINSLNKCKNWKMYSNKIYN